MPENKYDKKNLRTWIEVNQANLKHNYKQFRQLVGSQCKLMAVPKSNAYGHGIFDFSQAMVKLGIDWLAVDSIIEAIKLRQNNCNTPILVLGHTLPEMLKKAVENKISLTISNWEALREISPELINLKIHLKFDTGMYRQGFLVEEVEEVLQYFANNLPKIEIEGVYTHFAGAKNPAFPTGTQEQIARFLQVKESVLQHNLRPLFHASATSGAIVYPEAHFDLVRIGIGFYGLWPAKEVKAEYENTLKLLPILKWKTIVGEIKTIPAGARVGYDFTEQVGEETKMAVLPVGYWHGYDRSLSSKGFVIINKQRCKVLGRVSMDMIVVDITQAGKVAVGD